MISGERERIVKEFDRLHGRHPSKTEIETWSLQEFYVGYYGHESAMKVDGIWTAQNAIMVHGLILNLLG